MTDLMTVRAEVLPVAADQSGIWYLGPAGDTWRSEPIPANAEPHQSVEAVLRRHPGREARIADTDWFTPIPTPTGGSMLGDVVLLHNTSNRVEADSIILTYIAVLGGHGDDFALGTWPNAKPLGPALMAEVGRPIPHGPAEPPTPRYVDVLLHAVRHLRFLLDTDSTARAALDGHWRRHLEDLQPALAGMYQAS